MMKRSNKWTFAFIIGIAAIIATIVFSPLLQSRKTSKASEVEEQIFYGKEKLAD